MNENQSFSNFIIFALFLITIFLGVVCFKQSGDYHALEAELRTVRSELTGAQRNQRDAIEQLESITGRIDSTATEAESISYGIEDVKNRTEGDQGKISRSRELIDDCLKILRDSKRESEEAQRQTQ